MSSKTEDLLAQLDNLAYHSVGPIKLDDGSTVYSHELQLPQVQVEQARRLITECAMLMETVERISIDSDGIISFWTSYGVIYRVETDGDIAGWTHNEYYTVLSSAPKPAPVYTAEAVQQILGNDWYTDDDADLVKAMSLCIMVFGEKLAAFFCGDSSDWMTPTEVRNALERLEDACQRLAEHGYKIEGWQQ